MAEPKAVSIEPTAAMLTALWNRKEVNSPAELADAYLAMLSAAPPSPVTGLETMLAASLRKFVNSLAEQDDEGLIEHADSMIDARAALAAYEAKKEGK